QQHIDSFAGDTAADMKHEGLGIQARQRRQVAKARVGVVLRGHPIGGLDQPRRIEETERQNLPLDSRSAVKDQRCLLQAMQDPPHQEAIPLWPDLAGRLEYGTEGIEVVTIDSRPLRGQFMDQMRVAVVANVEELKFSPELAQVARIDPEAIEQAVGIQG